MIGCPLYRRHPWWIKYCTVVIFEEGVNIIEGISGGDNFTDGNEQEDCNHNEDLGVEAKKVCQVRFPVVIHESRRFITLKLWTGAKTA